MGTDEAGPFPVEALEANRSGVLTAGQRQSYARREARHGHDLYVAAFFVLVGVVALRSTGPARSAWARPFVGVGALAAAAFLVVRPKGPGRRRLERDVRAGHVESIEGAIEKVVVSSSGRSMARWYFLEIGGRRLKVGGRGYEAAPDAGIVRAYFLPSSLWVVNLERLPDPPLPQEALDSPAALVRTLAGLVGHHGREGAEARARLAGLMAAVAPQQAPDATPPPPPPRDPRPLEQAILGEWRSGALRASFSSDGTVAVQAPGTPLRQASWSVDGAGRLRSDALGHAEAGDAWVSGDTLTIALQGRALLFTRA